jgi:chromosome partitioning related protein ParA
MSESSNSAYTIATANTKGGVGKTTITANIGALCADLGQRVLLIDCDPKGSLTKYFSLSTLASNGLAMGSVGGVLMVAA